MATKRPVNFNAKRQRHDRAESRASAGRGRGDGPRRARRGPGNAGLGGPFGLPRRPTAPRDLNRKRGWTHKQVSNAKLRATGWTPEFPGFLDAAPGLAATLGSAAD